MPPTHQPSPAVLLANKRDSGCLGEPAMSAVAVGKFKTSTAARSASRTAAQHWQMHSAGPPGSRATDYARRSLRRTLAEPSVLIVTDHGPQCCDCLYRGLPIVHFRFNRACFELARCSISLCSRARTHAKLTRINWQRC